MRQMDDKWQRFFAMPNMRRPVCVSRIRVVVCAVCVCVSVRAQGTRTLARAHTANKTTKLCVTRRRRADAASSATQALCVFVGRLIHKNVWLPLLLLLVAADGLCSNKFR